MNKYQRIADNLMACLATRDRLAKMTPLELVNKALGSDAADYDVVIELMNRVLPGWVDMPEGTFEKMPESVEHKRAIHTPVFVLPITTQAYQQMVEQVARGLFDEREANLKDACPSNAVAKWSDCLEWGRELWRKRARAALAAIGIGRTS